MFKRSEIFQSIYGQAVTQARRLLQVRLKATGGLTVSEMVLYKPSHD